MGKLDIIVTMVGGVLQSNFRGKGAAPGPNSHGRVDAVNAFAGARYFSVHLHCYYLRLPKSRNLKVTDA